MTEVALAKSEPGLEDGDSPSNEAAPLALLRVGEQLRGALRSLRRLESRGPEGVEWACALVGTRIPGSAPGWAWRTESRRAQGAAVGVRPWASSQA